MLIRYRPPGHARHCSLTLLLLVVVQTLWTSGCCLNPSMADIGPLDEQPVLDFITVAHRGNIQKGRIPGNSLPALRASIETGVSFLEVDVRRSNDGALFLFHDGSFSRSNSSAPAHLRGIPVGTIASSERATVTLDNSVSIAVPTLADALSLIERSKSTLQLDLKGESDALTFAVLELVSARGLLHRVLLQLRSPERVALVLANYPTARVLARCKSPKQLQQVLQYRVEVVELERWLTSDAVRLAHAQGVLVAVNIAGSRLDEPNTWGYLRSRGVDMIMTDRANERGASAPLYTLRAD